MQKNEKAETRKQLSIIIPCYNEEQMLEPLWEALKIQLELLPDCKYGWEIIFVNDGSRDNTMAFLTKLAEEEKRIKYISFSRNFGKEAAMLAGLEYAAGDCAILLDADLQHPPELIPLMIKKYEEGYDQVIAKRNRKGDSRKLTALTNLYYRIMNKAAEVKLENGAGDFRLLSRDAIEAVLSLRETNRFSKGLFSWVGFHQTYIEYENRPRLKDKSKWSLRSLIRYGIDGMLSFNVQPLRICLYLGGTLLTISLFYLLYLFVRILLYGIDLPGYFTTITMISVLGGVQLISLGIIGEYVGRIYAEVKHRPPYIIAKTNMKKQGNGNEDTER